MIGVILAGGDGTRLERSTGQSICKPLRKINDKHLIEFALNNLIELNANAVYIVVGKQGDLIKTAIGESYKGLPVYYVHQAQQKGLIDALVQALNVIPCDEAVILQLADEIFVGLKAKIISDILDAEAFDFYCGVTTEDNPEKIKNNFSVETDEDFSLIRCTEKPKIVNNNIKGTGFSIFNRKTQSTIKEVYKNEPEKLGDICECFNYLIESGYQGKTFIVADKEFNINTALDLNEAEGFLN